MKFESKFGIGEIVAYEPHRREDKNCGDFDALMEVQAVIFGFKGDVMYLCRYPASGITVHFSECQLIGDPAFNQDTGYPVEAKE